MRLNYFLFLQIVPFLSLASSFNYIVNGGFEDPAIPAGTFIRINNNITGWKGIYFDLVNKQSRLGYHQHVDLQSAVGLNGYIEQTVSLPS